MAETKWVYGFDEVADAERGAGGDWEGVRALLGGKGANLGDMTRLGVPVPPGFTVSTAACLAFLAGGEAFPPGCWAQVEQALGRVEQATGKRFGAPDEPLLVSCRSGAKFSMPGMMDTVLNIGLNDEVAAGLVRLTGDERFVYDSYRRLVQMFGSVVLGQAGRGLRRSPGPPSPRGRGRHRLRAAGGAPQGHRRRVPGPGPGLPRRSQGAAAPGHRGGVQVLERQAGHRLPQRRRHRPRPGDGGEHPDDGVRQHGRRLRHRSGHVAQRHHRRAQDRRRLPHQRPG